MEAIQRPAASANALFWHPPRAAIPMGTPVVVGPQECVVLTLNGAILGVMPPGTYPLHPQSLPFVAPSVDPASNVTAELWFVRTDSFRGVQFGGPVGTQYDTLSQLQVTPRLFGEYTIQVVDAPRFVLSSMGMADADAVLATVSGVLLGKLKELYPRLVAEAGTVMLPPAVGMRLPNELAPMLGELASMGLRASLGNYNVSFPEGEQTALAAARGARDAKIAELNAANPGRAPGAGAGVPVVAPPPAGTPGAAPPYGGVPVIAPPAGGAPPVAGPAGPGPAGRSPKTGLYIGLGIAAVVVIGGGITLAVHFSRGGSNSHAPAQHDGRHGGRH